MADGTHASHLQSLTSKRLFRHSLDFPSETRLPTFLLDGKMKNFLNLQALVPVRITVSFEFTAVLSLLTVSSKESSGGTFNMLLGNVLGRTTVQAVKVLPSTKHGNTAQPSTWTLSTRTLFSTLSTSMFLVAIGDFILSTPVVPCFHQQCPPGHAGFLVAACPSSSSSLSPVTGAEAASTFLGICESSTLFPEARICVRRGSAEEQN